MKLLSNLAMLIINKPVFVLFKSSMNNSGSSSDRTTVATSLATDSYQVTSALGIQEIIAACDVALEVDVLREALLDEKATWNSGSVVATVCRNSSRIRSAIYNSHNIGEVTSGDRTVEAEANRVELEIFNRARSEANAGELNTCVSDVLRLRAAVAEMDASNAVVGALEIQVRLTPQWQALERERQVQTSRARALDDLRAQLAHSYGLPPEAQVNPQTGEITA
jgi:hypothetical protein